MPLIFILTVTAIKDGVEDWRRTVLDNELNNSPVYRLVDWVNVNSSEDNVSLWRRVKKACSRSVIGCVQIAEVYWIKKEEERWHNKDNER